MQIEIKPSSRTLLDYIFGTTWEWRLYDEGTVSGGYAASYESAERKGRRLAAQRKQARASHNLRMIIEVE